MKTMTVFDKREHTNLVSFSKILVGQAYEDVDGNICIKISDSAADDETSGECLCDHGGARWTIELEGLSNLVTPLETQLVIVK
jgi:hypothetical protein